MRRGLVLSSRVVCSSLSSLWALSRAGAQQPDEKRVGGARAGCRDAGRSRGAAEAAGPLHEWARIREPDCTLTWHGITVYGAYDIGVGWVSHGLPVNGYNYEGESLVNRNGYQHRFLVAPNNLQQTGFGVGARYNFARAGTWSSTLTGINPKSGLLANASKTDIINNGLPRASYSMAIDGRGGPSLSMTNIMAAYRPRSLARSTFGRQRSLGTDVMLLTDPAGGSYAFSYIGYNGTMSGGGDTEDSRWDDAMKYRLVSGPVHLGGDVQICGRQWRLLLGFGDVDCGELYAGDGAQQRVWRRSRRRARQVLRRRRLSALQPGHQRVESVARGRRVWRRRINPPPTASIPHSDHGRQSDPTEQHRLRHRDGQQRDHGRWQI